MNQSDKLDAIDALMRRNPCESHCDHEAHENGEHADPADCDCCMSCQIAWILYPGDTAT